MGKNKLFRFAEITRFTNVIEQSQTSETINDNPIKGKWNADFFKNNNPIVLELGCGKGEYTVGLGMSNPDKNFIGSDLKGNRIYIGSKIALENNYSNVGFLRTRIENIETSFAPEEVSEIWITFPDPQPQKPRERKRLTHPNFLKKYKNILKKGGIIHLKTDSELLYNYTLDVIKENKLPLYYNTDNLYADSNEELTEMKKIKTYYENKFSAQGFNITYIKFGL